MRVKNNKINLEVVASHLEKGKRAQNGRLVYDGWTLDLASAAIFSAFEFDPKIVDSARQRIIHEALFSLDPSKRITSKLVTSALARSEETYLRLPEQRYSLLTSVSAKFGDHFKDIRDGRVRIRFLRNRPARFDRRPFEKIHSWPDQPDVQDYTIVIVTVDARTANEAFERAVRDLDFHRGMWNYALTQSTISRSSGSPQPLGDIGLGRVHTIHRATGAAVGGTFWYQTSFTPQPVVDVRRDWERVIDIAAVVRRKSRQDGYGAELREVFVRYTRALDGVDFDSTFLKLWSLLELLTATTSARYDQTINRALFVFQEQELNRVLLEHLRD